MDDSRKNTIIVIGIISILILLFAILSVVNIYAQDNNKSTKDKIETKSENSKEKSPNKNTTSKTNLKHNEDLKKSNDLNQALPSKEHYSAARNEYGLDENTANVTDNLFWETLLILFILGASILFIYKFVKKRRNIAFIDTEDIRVIGTTPIALNKYLQLVEISDKIIIIGVGEHSVNFITEITDKETVDKIKLNSSKNVSYQVKDTFNKFLNKFQKNTSENAEKRYNDYEINSQKKAKYFNNSKTFNDGETDKDNPIKDLDYITEQKERLNKLNNG